MAASKKDDKARAILSYATPNPVGPYRLVTPPSPDLGRKTQTPILPVMGGTLVNLPTPVAPTKQTTPVAPPMADKFVNVPKQQGRVIERSSSYDPASYVMGGDMDYWSATLRGATVDDRTTAKQRESHEKARRYLEQEAKKGTIFGQIYESGKLPYQGAERSEVERYNVDRAMQEIWYAYEHIPKNLIEDYFEAKRYAERDGYDSMKNLGEIFDAKNFSRVLRDLTPDEQKTAVVLAKGWSGTAKELRDAARSLSK